MSVSDNCVASDAAFRVLRRWAVVVIIAAVVLATAACERSTPGPRRDARAELLESDPSVAVRPAEISVRPIEIKNWAVAPAACSVPPTDAPARSETAAAMMAFMRWVALMVDPAQPSAGPWYLREVRQVAVKEGATIMLVPPPGYEVAWAGDSRSAASREQASQAASTVLAVELEVRGTVERGRGASPVIGYLWTRGFDDSQQWGQFGVGVEFCVLPAIDGVSPVYLRKRFQS